MKVIAVVPTMQRPKLLQRCLTSLERYARVIDDVIIVRDIFPIAEARNIGVAKAPTGCIIFSIDDDCAYDENLNLEISLERVLVPDTGIVQVTRWMKKYGKRIPPFEKRRFIFQPLVWQGAGQLFRKEVWEEVGGFPKDYLEDVMFSAVVYGAGYRNYRSQFSYGIHDPDQEGGMKYILAKHPEAYYRCHPERYLVTGDPCWSRQGHIPNIKNIKPTQELRLLHRKNWRKRWT